MLLYLKGTRHRKLKLCVTAEGEIRWWADASYNAPKDCKGHTGYLMTFGKGAVISDSKKHKTNVRSSTES